MILSLRAISTMKTFSKPYAPPPASNFNFYEFPARLRKSVSYRELTTKTTEHEIKMRLNFKMEKIEMQIPEAPQEEGLCGLSRHS